MAPRLIRLPEMPSLYHADEGEQHRERNRERDDQAALQTSEQQEQNGDDEQPAFHQVPGDRVYGRRTRSVRSYKRFDFHSGRQVSPNVVELS